jgi:hypothetical protein
MEPVSEPLPQHIILYAIAGAFGVATPEIHGEHYAETILGAIRGPLALTPEVGEPPQQQQEERDVSHRIAAAVSQLCLMVYSAASQVPVEAAAYVRIVVRTAWGHLPASDLDAWGDAGRWIADELDAQISRSFSVGRGMLYLMEKYPGQRPCIAVTSSGEHLAAGILEGDPVAVAGGPVAVLIDI